MTPDNHIIESVMSYEGKIHVVVGNGKTLPISSFGTLTLYTSTRPLTLKSILIDPRLTSNLLSIGKFVTNNLCLSEFNPFGYIVKDFITKIPLVVGSIHNNLHLIKIPSGLGNHFVLFAS